MAGRLDEFPGVLEANVYGVPVPNTDGRAGMAAVVVDERFGVPEFSKYVETELPHYAQPVFLRILPKIETTGTFKHRKADLVAEGFDPGKIKHRLYVRIPGKGYQRLNAKSFDKIQVGETRL